MIFDTFKNWFSVPPSQVPSAAKAAEPVTEVRSAAVEQTEKRNFDLKSAEAQRLFVFGMSHDDGIVVTDDTILSSTPFFGAMRYISEGIAMLSRKVKTKNDERYYDDDEHPVAYLFKRRPNHTMTWADLFQAWVCNAMLGNGYVRIYWDPITAYPIALEHIPSRYVLPEFDQFGVLWYRISGELNGRQVTTVIPHTDMLHLKGLSLDGLLGRKTSITHKPVHGASLSADYYTQSVFEKGAFPSIAVKTQDSLDATEIATMEQNIMNRIGSTRNAGRPLVLDDGQDVQYLQWSPLDVALEQVKHLSVEQVCQITKVPRDLLGLDNRGTLGGTIQRSKDFYVHCLQPWVTKIEEEICTKLFMDVDIILGRHKFELDNSLYLSLSQKEQVEMFEVAIRSSQMTPNEAREALGRDSKPNGDSLYGDINHLPLEQLLQVAVAKYLSADGEKSSAGQGIISNSSNSDNEQQTQSSK